MIIIAHKIANMQHWERAPNVPRRSRAVARWIIRWPKVRWRADWGRRWGQGISGKRTECTHGRNAFVYIIQISGGMNDSDILSVLDPSVWGNIMLTFPVRTRAASWSELGGELASIREANENASAYRGESSIIHVLIISQKRHNSRFAFVIDSGSGGDDAYVCQVVPWYVRECEWWRTIGAEQVLHKLARRYSKNWNNDWLMFIHKLMY